MSQMWFLQSLGKMLTNSFAYMPFLLIDEYTNNTQTVNRSTTELKLIIALTL